MKLKKLEIRYLPISSLHSNRHNPRVHSPKQLTQLAESIRTFGFNVPILVDSELQVIAGHGRLKACKLVGITEVPVIALNHLAEHQKRAFLIADNRLTENSSWDERMLGEQMKILAEAELDFSLEITGFEMGEIDLIIENLRPAGSNGDEPADAIPETSNPQVTRIGDLWKLGPHRVLCGDAASACSYKILMGADRAHCVFTDPPYNVRIGGNVSGKGKVRHREFVMASGEMSETEFTEFLSSVLNLVARSTRSGSLHFVCIDWRHTKEMFVASNGVYSELKNLCVWIKDNAGMGSLYRSQHEFVFVFKHGDAPHRNNVRLGQFGRSRTNVWHYPGANSFSRSSREGNLLALHPTVKPVAMVSDAILDCTVRGNIVLDPFLGSGTTLISAERVGRICYGLELDPPYVDVIVRRWQAFTGLDAELGETGQTFSQREEEIRRERE